MRPTFSGHLFDIFPYTLATIYFWKIIYLQLDVIRFDCSPFVVIS